MGTNKRYADAIDKRMAAHTDEIIMRDRQPSSLKKEELELDRLPLTRTPVAIPAWAWIHYDHRPPTTSRDSRLDAASLRGSVDYACRT